MGAKRIAFDHEARDAVRRGVQKLAKAVMVTLGPRGRNVVLEKSFGAPTVTKDGVTVAREIELEDSFENMGAQMVKEVSSKTSDNAGDGTTTAPVLASAIFHEGLRNVTAGANPVCLQRGIQKAVENIIEQLGVMSTEVKDKTEIAQVGSIAANNDPEIGNIIADAMEKVGKDGVITVEEGKSLDTTVDWVEGMQVDKGYDKLRTFAAKHGIDVVIPVKKRRKVAGAQDKSRKKFARESVRGDRKTARTRIHSEREMIRVKNYKLLTQMLPMEYKDILDDLIWLCVCLGNLDVGLTSKDYEETVASKRRKSAASA